MKEKLEELKALIEKDKTDFYAKHYPDITGLLLEKSITVNIRPGQKYIKIDIGSSGKYMVEGLTGNIYGIKAYGVIHRGHQYGTLDTINQYFWGDYTAQRRANT